MAAKNTEKTYLAAQEKVKAMLATALKIKALDAEELMVILYILGQTSTTVELESFIDIFSESFPVLGDYAVSQKAELKGDLEERVKTAVSKIVQEDPLRAAEITKEALKPGAVWEEMIKKFPELKEE